MFKRLSLSNRFFLNSVGIIAFSVLLIAILTLSIFNNSQRRLVESTSTEINKQIVFNFDNYLESVIDALYFLQLETHNTTDEDLEALKALYESVQTVDRTISAIYLFDLEGNPIINTLRHRELEENLSSESFFVKAREDSRIFHFSSPHEQPHIKDSQQNVVTISRRIEYFSEGERKEGILAIDLLTDTLTAIARQADLGEFGHIVIYDAQGTLVYATNGCLEGCESLEVAQALILGGSERRVDGVDYYVQVSTLKYARWTMATFSDITPIYETRTIMILSISSVFLGAILLGSLVAKLNASRISQPLTKLQEKMHEIQSHKKFLPVKVTGQKEVVSLSEAFNAMSEEINSLMARVISEQKAKRKTQFVALQNQINPHFLYNTLDSILYLSEENKNEEVQRMVQALSKFFRISISNESGVVSLHEEIEHVKSYLNIQQIRYHNTFDFRIDVAPNLMQEKVLKLGLQPLVENAIHHGIDQGAEDNLITVQAYKKENDLIIVVENSGYGLTADSIAQIETSFKTGEETNHIGLRNIYARLKLYFGDESSLSFESEMDHYTRVVIKIPTKKGAFES